MQVVVEGHWGKSCGRLGGRGRRTSRTASAKSRWSEDQDKSAWTCFGGESLIRGCRAGVREMQGVGKSDCGRRLEVQGWRERQGQRADSAWR